ncbi:MAG: YncE family protein [Thaumarchaeota archaeon]|nr:YncE family protein [Nitrososphaerota archaeon]
MNIRRSRKSLLLLASAILAAIIIIGLAIQLYPGPSARTNSSSQSTSALGQNSSSASYLSLSRTIPLPPTQGRIDHMSVDPGRGLLFVANYVNNTVAIVDINSGRFLHSIGGLNNPQGVAWVPDAGRLFVSNAGDGTVDIFNGSSFAPVGKITLSGDADNLRYDSGTKLLYVGYGSGGISAINTTSDAVMTTKALPAHPESFQVEANGRAVYVNVPSSNLITAFDKTTGSSILNRSMTGSNFPMALDEAGGRLFIATRNPSELRVLDTSTPSLRSVANVTIAGDPDDVFFDASHGLVYVSCGGGSLEVIKQADPTHYSVVETVATGQGARTSLLVPQLASILVAVPASTGQQAEILAYGFGSAVANSSSPTSPTSASPIPAAASLSAAPVKGPSGLLVTIAGSGYFPGAMYQVCVAAFGNTSCGFEYTSAGYLATIGGFATMGTFVADSAGNIPAGTKMAVPDLFEGGYSLGIVRDGEDAFFVSTPFTVESPSLSMGATSVVPKTNVTLTGSGYAHSTTYTVCMVLAGTSDCGYPGDREETPPGIHLGTFTTDVNGNIPSGTKVTIPLVQPSPQVIGIFLPSGGFILISQVQFTLTAST